VTPVHLRGRWLRPALTLVAVVVAYYAWPVNEEGAGLVAGVLVTLAAVALVAWAIAGQVRRHLVQGEHVGLPALLTLLVVVVVVFASGQLARQLALVQMVFDVVFVAAAGSMLAGTVRERLRPPAEPGADQGGRG
jgi:hypothetical protein